jgi:hypothetical protein
VGDDSFLLKSKTATQGVKCGWARCHGVGPRNCCATGLDIVPDVFPHPPQNIVIEVSIHVLS